MNRLLLAFACFGVLALSAFGQASRPRVVATPTPTAPRIQNDTLPTVDDRGAPVLRGGSQNRSQTPVTSATPPTNTDDEEIKIETSLVTMPVSVIDRDGRFISGLQQKDFKIYENGVEQKVDYFQSVEQPFTVVLMIDVSPSTRFQIDQIHAAAIAFIEQLRPNDRVMVIAFDDNVQVLSPPTNNRNQLRNAIQEAQFGDGTSLYEAVDHALNRELNRIEGRKAIVLFTDGVDTTSRQANYQSTVQDAEETDTMIYPIRYNTQPNGFGRGGGGGGQRRRGGGGGRGGWDDLIGILLGGQIQIGGSAGSSNSEYETGRKYLEALAQNSGGRKFEADSITNLDAAFSGIAEELRRQYSLGYYPDNVGQKGERKQIKINVMRQNVVVRAKTSYIVGQNENRLAGR